MIRRTIRVGDRIQAERTRSALPSGKCDYDAPAPTHWGTVRRVLGRVLEVEWDDGDPRYRLSLVPADGPQITQYHDGRRSGPAIDVSACAR